jgi:hypothetical protein
MPLLRIDAAASGFSFAILHPYFTSEIEEAFETGLV